MQLCRRTRRSRLSERPGSGGLHRCLLPPLFRDLLDWHPGCGHRKHFDGRSRGSVVWCRLSWQPLRRRSDARQTGRLVRNLANPALLPPYCSCAELKGPHSPDSVGRRWQVHQDDCVASATIGLSLSTARRTWPFSPHLHLNPSPPSPHCFPPLPPIKPPCSTAISLAG